MKPEQAQRLSCEECGREQTDDERGWKAYRTFEEDEPPETHVFCPECAEREFGGPAANAR